MFVKTKQGIFRVDIVVIPSIPTCCGTISFVPYPYRCSPSKSTRIRDVCASQLPHPPLDCSFDVDSFWYRYYKPVTKFWRAIVSISTAIACMIALSRTINEPSFPLARWLSISSVAYFKPPSLTQGFRRYRNHRLSRLASVHRIIN